MFRYFRCWKKYQHTFSKSLKLILGMLLSACFVSTVQAYEVSPLIMEMAPSGPDAVENIDIKNPHDYRLILEFSAIERTVGANGVESELSADDDFLIFPPQIIVDPHKSQRVQVRYIGQPLASSKAYRIIIDQVPVKQAEGQTRLDLAYKFRTAVYVIPEGAKFDIAVTHIEPDPDGGLLVNMENNGNRHAVLLSEPWSVIDTGGSTVKIDAREIPDVKKSPLISAGGQRTVSIPASLLKSIGDVQSVLIEPRR